MYLTLTIFEVSASSHYAILSYSKIAFKAYNFSNIAARIQAVCTSRLYNTWLICFLTVTRRLTTYTNYIQKLHGLDFATTCCGKMQHNFLSYGLNFSRIEKLCGVNRCIYYLFYSMNDKWYDFTMWKNRMV